MRQLSEITIGADVELFFKHIAADEYISAEGHVKGSKREPFNFDKTNKNFICSLDNVAVEIGIPPVTTAEEWEEYLMRGVSYVDSIAPKNTCSVAIPAVIFDPKYLQTPNAQEFGCEADFCVWTRSINPRPSAADLRLRSAGGHIHVGHDLANTEEKETADEKIIKSMDIFLGVPSVLLEPDNQRKELYGKAGCFRFKPYGVEYRTISNYYMVSPQLRRWAFENTQHAINFVNASNREDLVSEEEGYDIVRAIDTNDKPLAKEIIEQYKVPLCL